MKTGDLERNFVETTYQDNMDKLNTGLANISFKDNIDGQLKDITRPITSGEEINVPHILGGVPLGMLVLRQRGGGLVTDGTIAWTQEKITIINNGPGTIEFLRIFIVRD